MIEFLSTVCGVEPSEPGFKKVKIQPHLGSLTEASAAVPHPLGTIRVALKRTGKNGITADITLPDGLTGEFIWNNQTVALKGGHQVVKK